MIIEHKNKNITWVDLENPTQDEARKVAEKYHIDPFVADELLAPTLRPKVDYHDNYIYLILHFPIAQGKDSDENPRNRIQEVDFIIGEKFIITTRYNAVDALLEFSKAFEVQAILNRFKSYDHAGYLFFYMIQHLYRSFMNRLESISDQLTDIEHKIFSGQEKQMVFEISKLNRLLLNYQQATHMHKEILESFQTAGTKLFGKDFGYHLHGILGEYHRVKNEMAGSKDYLDELRNTNDSLLSTKQNEVMKILTVTTFIVLPLSLIAGIFGMNTKSTPIVGHPQDFLIVLGVMLVITGSLFILFRFKKLL